MALQLKKINSVTKEALDVFTAGWQGEEIIPSTINKYNGDMEEFRAYVETMEKGDYWDLRHRSCAHLHRYLLYPAHE